MYNIEKKDYGYKLMFSGFISAAEMKIWVGESKKRLSEGPDKFGILVDIEH